MKNNTTQGNEMKRSLKITNKNGFVTVRVMEGEKCIFVRVVSAKNLRQVDRAINKADSLIYC